MLLVEPIVVDLAKSDNVLKKKFIQSTALVKTSLNKVVIIIFDICSLKMALLPQDCSKGTYIALIKILVCLSIVLE